MPGINLKIEAANQQEKMRAKKVPGTNQKIVKSILLARKISLKYTHGYTPIDGIGSMVGALKSEAGGTYYQYPIYDHRGTVVRLVDENEDTVGAYSYNAWGVPLSEQETGASNRFRYQSNWIDLGDSNGELVLSPMRVYCAGDGRFLQRDRLGFVDGFGLYEAFGGDAVVGVDSQGDDSYKFWIKKSPAVKQEYIDYYKRYCNEVTLKFKEAYWSNETEKKRLQYLEFTLIQFNLRWENPNAWGLRKKKEVGCQALEIIGCQALLEIIGCQALLEFERKIDKFLN